jgi:DNA-binding PadR family transcriptional regulator
MIRAWIQQRRGEAERRIMFVIPDEFSDRWMGGYEISRATGLRSARVYTALRRLMEGGWITDTWVPQPDGRPPLRKYQVKGRITRL